MAKVKVFEAATEGFRLIQREPVAVLVWSAVLILVIGLPVALMFNHVGPVFAQFGQADAHESPEAAFDTLRGAFAFMPIIWLGSLVGHTLVGGAIIRSVIAPSDRRYFYLRASKAEAFMVLSALVGAIAAYIAALVLRMILGVVIVFPAAMLMSGAAVEPNSPLASAIFALVMLTLQVGVFYLILRFSMAPLMAFDEKRFRLFESWKFTKGEGWRLLGMVLVIVLAILLFESLLAAVAFAGFGSSLTAAMNNDPAALNALMDKIIALMISPGIWIVAVVGYLFGGPVMALTIAPFARVYAMLKPRLAEAESELVTPAA